VLGHLVVFQEPLGEVEEDPELVEVLREQLQEAVVGHPVEELEKPLQQVEVVEEDPAGAEVLAQGRLQQLVGVDPAEAEVVQGRLQELVEVYLVEVEKAPPQVLLRELVDPVGVEKEPLQELAEEDLVEVMGPLLVLEDPVEFPVWP
jgi:hypothetical protein